MEKIINFYDELEIKSSRQDLQYHIERIRHNGFTLIDELLTTTEAEAFSEKIDSIYRRQYEEVGGEDKLTKIGEVGVARNLIDYDPDFLKLVTNEDVLVIV